jgi:hypothetical protein
MKQLILISKLSRVSVRIQNPYEAIYLEATLLHMRIKTSHQQVKFSLT